MIGFGDRVNINYTLPYITRTFSHMFEGLYDTWELVEVNAAWNDAPQMWHGQFLQEKWTFCVPRKRREESPCVPMSCGCDFYSWSNGLTCLIRCFTCAACIISRSLQYLVVVTSDESSKGSHSSLISNCLEYEDIFF